MHGAKRKFTDEQILESLQVSPSVSAAARRIGMSDSALERRCDMGDLAIAYEECAARGRAQMKDGAFRKQVRGAAVAASPAGGE